MIFIVGYIKKMHRVGIYTIKLIISHHSLVTNIHVFFEENSFMIAHLNIHTENTKKVQFKKHLIIVTH